MGYGVIGSPADSDSASLGSSPGTPAQHQLYPAPSSSGLGRRPLKEGAPVRTRSGLHKQALRFGGEFCLPAGTRNSELPAETDLPPGADRFLPLRPAIAP